MAYASLRGDMPCWHRHRGGFPEKSKAQEHITNDAMLHSGFSRKMGVLNFFKDSRIRINNSSEFDFLNNKN